MAYGVSRKAYHMLAVASWWRLAVVVNAAALAGACSVADSFHIDPAAVSASAFSDAVPTLCRSTLGSYALPKSFLRIAVQRTGDGVAELLEPRTVVRADRSLKFCLDHIVDPLADDEIRVIKASGQLDESYKEGTKKLPASQYLVADKIEGNKDYGSQLLQWVVSSTVDQSERIARTLIRTAFIALSGKPNFTPLGRTGGAAGAQSQPSTVAVFEYDPFDPEQSARHNQMLRNFGYCLVLENFTFDARMMTAAQYCSAPRYEAFPYSEAHALYRSGPPPKIAGIAYRPRINYALSIYRNDNPKGRGSWRLARQDRVALENISPIVSIGVDRSLFAARKVALKFQMGTLEAMCLVKTSELESAVKVPYEIAKSIVALPTQIFEVKIGNISDNIDLLTAESNVVKAQQQYLDFLADPKQTAFNNTSSKKAEALGEIPNPVPVTSPVGPSTVANMDALQSSILTQICRDAPSVIVPDPRAKQGVP